MPQNGSEIIVTKENLYIVVGFPGVIGCVDGSHMPIISPNFEEFA